MRGIIMQNQDIVSSISNNNRVVFIDGEWYDESNACIPVFDHALLYGDGVYEGMRAYAGQVFLLDAHLQRLARSARCLSLRIPMSADRLSTLIEEGLQANNLKDAYIRLLVTRGSGPIGPDPSPCNEPRVILMIKDLPPLHGDKSCGIRVALSTVRRCGVDSATAQIKSLNYLPTILAKIEANRIGVDDVVMLDIRGFLAEAPVANVFLVRDGIALTPAKSSGILEGITRGKVIELLKTQGIPVFEQDLTPYDISVADEIFLTGTHAEIVPVREYNGKSLAIVPGPVTTYVQQAYGLAKYAHRK